MGGGGALPIHNLNLHCAQYQSFLVGNLVRALTVPNLQQGYLFVHVENDRCWGSYSNTGEIPRDPGAPRPPSPCVIHVEVLFNNNLHNLLVYATPLQAAVIGVCAEEVVFSLIPWQTILGRRPCTVQEVPDRDLFVHWLWMTTNHHLGEPLSPYRTRLLNPGETEQCNPMRYMLWLHAIMIGPSLPRRRGRGARRAGLREKQQRRPRH